MILYRYFRIRIIEHHINLLTRDAKIFALKKNGFVRLYRLSLRQVRNFKSMMTCIRIFCLLYLSKKLLCLLLLHGYIKKFCIPHQKLKTFKTLIITFMISGFFVLYQHLYLFRREKLKHTCK